jgi:hypothetical protein
MSAGKMGQPIPGDANKGTLPSTLGESHMKQYIMVSSSAGLGFESGCAGKAQEQLHK